MAAFAFRFRKSPAKVVENARSIQTGALKIPNFFIFQSNFFVVLRSKSYTWRSPKRRRRLTVGFENAEEDLTDPVRCNSLEEIKALREAHNQFQESLITAEEDFKQLKVYLCTKRMFWRWGLTPLPPPWTQLEIRILYGFCKTISKFLDSPSVKFLEFTLTFWGAFGVSRLFALDVLIIITWRHFPGSRSTNQIVQCRSQSVYLVHYGRFGRDVA